MIILFILINLVGCNHKDVVTNPQVNMKQPNTNIDQQNTTDFYQPSIIANDETEPEIASILLERYLQHYKSNDMSEYERLKDYKISEIIIKDKTNDGFIYTARFSVQGVIENTAWGAGNGILNGQGWIEDKFVFVTVKHKDNTYTMIGWATGL